MAWHMGYPLSQSLFTSSYIDSLLWPKPRTLEEARFDRDVEPRQKKGLLHLVLRAYCLALIKSCGSVLGVICRENFYEVSISNVSTSYRKRINATRRKTL